MKRWLYFLLPLIILVSIGIIVSQNQKPDLIQSTILLDEKEPVSDDFSRATEVKPLNFPQDHGAHPDFQTEWWYYTGNLQAEDGRRFGYQLTFFRRALLPLEALQERPSQWAASQVYMAHFALSDVGNQEFQAFERLARGAAGLSGAQAAPFRVWLQDWSVEEISANQQGLPIYRLQAAQNEIQLDLILDDLKGPILQGDQGFSRKGPEVGQASYYYSLTRLKTTGTVTIGKSSFPVEGFSWMDHEFSTSVLSSDQVGWDWFSIQLTDGSELMMFQIRKADGSIDPFSSGAWISSDGRKSNLSQKDFQVSVMENWRSPHSNAVYPSGWVITIPSLDLQLEIQPQILDQELNLSYSYWEGTVSIAGTRDGKAITGNGYVELTGYSGSMGGEF